MMNKITPEDLQRIFGETEELGNAEIEFLMSKFIAAEGCEYSLDDYETNLNNNVLIVGGSGTGKTRKIVPLLIARQWQRLSTSQAPSKINRQQRKPIKPNTINFHHLSPPEIFIFAEVCEGLLKFSEMSGTLSFSASIRSINVSIGTGTIACSLSPCFFS